MLRALFGFLLGFLALVGHPAAAQRFDDTVTLKVEAYFAGVDSFLQVGNSSGSLGTAIDLEDVLRLDNRQTLPAFELGWRINDDWVVNAEYYRLGRRTGTTLDQDITIDDTVFPVSGQVNAGFDSDVYRLTFGNLLFQGERLEIGAAVGVHGTNFKVFVEGQGSAGGQESEFRSERRSIFAPLPTIGAFAQWEPAKRVTVGARLDWLSLTISDYSGRLVNTEASASYRVQKHVDIGASYRFVDYRLKVRKPDWNGEIRYQFSGPAIFIRAGF